eukprot:GHRR01018258.1.p1 GENE.GHRR01018258.1~~GHRR01018258.1.p1  ORF type:complete len:376 (+),score=134.91 GHRR01018258.1:1076-2203(+)
MQHRNSTQLPVGDFSPAPSGLAAGDVFSQHETAPAAAPGHPDTSPVDGLNQSNSQDLEGIAIPDSGFAGRELYRALRGAEDSLADELLWDGDFLISQREFIQKRQDEQLLERLERRMGRDAVAPRSEGGAAESPGGALGSAAASLGAATFAASRGRKLKGMLDRIRQKGPAADEPAQAAAIAAAPAATPQSPAAAAAANVACGIAAALQAARAKAGLSSSADGAAARSALEASKAMSLSADGGKARTTTSLPGTPRLLTKLVEPFRQASPRGLLGNLMAPDDESIAKAATGADAARASAAASADGSVEVCSCISKSAGYRVHTVQYSHLLLHNCLQQTAAACTGSSTLVAAIAGAPWRAQIGDIVLCHLCMLSGR